MVKVKICGITNVADARVSVKAGCDAIGFVFYKKSPRYISPYEAAGIIKQLPEHTLTMGVFVNAREKTIRRIARLCSLSVLQFHGNESAEFCARFKDYKVIKAFRIKHKLDEAKIARYKTSAYLFDTYVASKVGGTGKRFDWKLIRHLRDLKRPIFLSGGLTAKNVLEAVKVARPDWVDVSSSLEISPGKKDHAKVTAFIRSIRKIPG
ncbi:MAG: phosphoribosylanthranilate isomerase [Candidatus Omnitrophota bacterium]|jgi:phosphoribosylanthranilate isomerase